MRDENTAPPVSPVAAPQGYAHAALPEPFRILGRRLRPFSLGHYLLLQRFGCGLLSAEGGAQSAEASEARADVILGVLICSLRHDEFLEFLEQKDFLAQLQRWGKQCGLFDVAEKTALFAQYLAASLREPDYIPLQPGDDSGDWAQNLLTTLVTRLGYSQTEALDAPVARALADYFKLAENEGLIRLLTPEDVAMGAANAKALAEWEAGEIKSKSKIKSKSGEATCPA